VKAFALVAHQAGKKAASGPTEGNSFRSLRRAANIAAEEDVVRAPEILQSPAMPLALPSHPCGPYRFADRDRVPAPQ